MIKKVSSAKRSQSGFTLIEILIVIGIIAILAAVVIVAVNPARQFAKARNSQRSSNVNAILNAVHQYGVDNRGTLPATITSSSTPVCQTDAVDCTGLIDLSVLTANGIYIVAMPIDPSCEVNNSTCYEIAQGTNGRITVDAPLADLEEVITVTR